MRIVRPRLRFSTASPEAWDLIAAAALAVAGALVVRADWAHPLVPAGLAVATAGVAFRRRYPALATTAAVGGTVVLQRAAGSVDLTAEAVAIALCFYLLGSRSAGSRRWSVAVGPLALWLAAAVVVGRGTGSGSPGAVAMTWLTTAVMPLGLGAAVARQRSRAALLEELAVQLAAEEELRTMLAAEEERCRIARDLHDGVAHGVSVMVIQAGAAARILTGDLGGALAALDAVKESGREALRDLRRIVGVVRQQKVADGEPRLSELPALLERAAGAGLEARLSLPEGLQLPLAIEATVYRVVQEALTNTIKHSGATAASVVIRLADSGLEVSIADDGGGGVARRWPGAAAREHGSGRGLAGMRERIAEQGGDLEAGERECGGFQVRASLPITTETDALEAGTPRRSDRAVLGRLRRWADPGLAAVALVAMEAEAVVSRHRSGSLTLNALVVAAMAAASLGRRRHPVAFLVVVAGLSAVLAGGLTSFGHATITGAYVLVVPLWTVATCASRGRATLALIGFSAGAATTMALTAPQQSGGLLGAEVVGLIVWSAGVVLQAHRRTTHELQRRAEQVRQRRQERVRIAAASESTRLARELQTGIAHALAVIVVETEAAQRLVATGDPKGAEAIGQIEDAARRALAEMRATLGVLRRSDREDDLRAQRAPGHLPRLGARERLGLQPQPVATSS